MQRLRTLVIALLLPCTVAAQSPPPLSGAVEKIATREHVTVPVYAYWRDDAVATIVLFSGGGGGYGMIGDDGWPAGRNFLIRTGKRWASQPFNVVMVGRPSDGIDLAAGHIRIGKLHAADNAALFKAIRRKSPLPIWAIGTSMGTISVTAAAIADRENLLSGIVLTSSILAYKVRGAVPAQNLEAIRIPTLIVHHANDACWACQPHEVANIASGLRHVPLKKTQFITGGSGVSGDPCEPDHHHGFIGQQDEVVDWIAQWIRTPTD